MSGFDLEKIGAFITGAGFSVFVALWFMVKHDSRLRELSEAIVELRLTLLLFRQGGNFGAGPGVGADRRGSEG